MFTYVWQRVMLMCWEGPRGGSNTAYLTYQNENTCNGANKEGSGPGISLWKVTTKLRPVMATKEWAGHWQLDGNSSMPLFLHEQTNNKNNNQECSRSILWLRVIFKVKTNSGPFRSRSLVPRSIKLIRKLNYSIRKISPRVWDGTEKSFDGGSRHDKSREEFKFELVHVDVRPTGEDDGPVVWTQTACEFDKGSTASYILADPLCRLLVFIARELCLWSDKHLIQTLTQQETPHIHSRTF